MCVAGDKGKVLLEEVRKVKEALRQQKEATDTQREVGVYSMSVLPLASIRTLNSSLSSVTLYCMCVYVPLHFVGQQLEFPLPPIAGCSQHQDS